ncbi:hypothetical protein E4T48_04060 [Aureobasidium sp. EXF-10727]|nr:hypothetical protein E4T48_04060 [Aureobasidium sp. EXF-10727]
MCVRVADETTGNKDMHGCCGSPAGDWLRLHASRLSLPATADTTTESRNAWWSLFGGSRFEQLAGFVVHLQTIGTTGAAEPGSLPKACFHPFFLHIIISASTTTPTNIIPTTINMKSFAVAAALAGAAVAMPQGVTQAISPKSGPPSGCSTNYDGQFSISITNVTTTPKRDLETRADKVLTITLKDGTLTDDEGRTGYIAANNQFQFDKPAQTGAIYTSGFSVCGNGTLAIGNSAIFYQCLSGNFYNLYDQSTGNQCSPIYINVLKSGAAASSGAATQIGDGQLQAATSTKAVTQISDGQIQASTAAAPVTQISDGQIQASTGKPVTQISDGQIQAPTSTATAKPVTQISDGQIQAPTATAKPVTQISDGQIQAPTSTGKPVTQISDGQIQAPTGGATRPSNGTVVAGAATASSVVAYTGAAAMPTFAGEMLIAAGAFAVAFL